MEVNIYMNISIVVPNFNGKDLLLKNVPKVIEAFKEYKNGFVELIITDDASKDESIDVIKKMLTEKKYHAPKQFSYSILENMSGRNRGFSGNINNGVKNAKGDILVLLNTDVVPKENFWKPLLSHFSDESIFAVGCMDESVEDGKIILRGRGVGTWKRGFLMHSAGELTNSSTLWVSGGSGAFRKSVWDILGGLNELYNPFYWEDIDISYRAQKAGYTVIFEKKSIVRHEHSQGAIKTFYKPFRIQKIVYRNQFLFTWLNLTDTMLIASHFLWLPYHFLNAVRNKDVAFFYGFITALAQVPNVLGYRAKTQKLQKRTDREVIEGIGS